MAIPYAEVALAALDAALLLYSGFDDCIYGS